ncbi:hypothetical protein MMPV_009883 [Pyropia vietnamensis]
MASLVVPRRRVLAAAAAAVVAAVVVTAATVGGSPAGAPKKGCHDDHGSPAAPMSAPQDTTPPPSSPSPPPVEEATDEPHRPTYKRRMSEPEEDEPEKPPPSYAQPTESPSASPSVPPTAAPTTQPPTEPPVAPTPTESPVAPPPTEPPTEPSEAPPPTEPPIVPPPTKAPPPTESPSPAPERETAPVTGKRPTPTESPPPPNTCAAGDKTCKASPTPPPAAASRAPPAKETPEPDSPYAPPEDFVKSVKNKSCSGVIGFVLVEVETGKDLFILREGDIIPKDPLLTIKAVTSPGFDVGDVRFSLAGKFIRTEEYYPYSISGDDTRGSFFPWAGRSTLRPGLHKLSATPEFGAGLDVHVKFVDAKTVAFPKDRSLTTFILKRGQPPCGMDVATATKDPPAEKNEEMPSKSSDPKATPCKKHPNAHGKPTVKEDEMGVDMKTMKKEVAYGDCVVCAKRHSPGFAERFKVERICEAVYADAPLWTSPEDGVLFYSDPPKRMVLMWNASTNEVTPLWKDAGLVNGLAWGTDGKLLATQRVVGKVVELDVEDPQLPDTATTSIVVDKHDGKKLSDPNDLVVSEQGEVFALFKGDTEPTLIDGTLKRPQGVVLDRAEEYLYVSDWQTRSWLRYDVKNGKASGDWNKVVAYQVAATDRREGRPDGMCIDNQDRVFAAGPGGIWLFGPGFKYEGVIPTPEGAIAVTETALGELAVPGQTELEKVLFFTTDEGGLAAAQ